MERSPNFHRMPHALGSILELKMQYKDRTPKSACDLVSNPSCCNKLTDPGIITNNEIAGICPILGKRRTRMLTFDQMTRLF